MNHWKSMLKGDQTNWLLEDDNPSVRYFTLVDLLEKAKNDPEVRKTREEIMKKGVVPRILIKQKEEGYWEEAEKFYTAKYKGTVWQIIILAELAAEKIVALRKLANSLWKTLKIVKVMVFLYG